MCAAIFNAPHGIAPPSTARDLSLCAEDIDGGANDAEEEDDRLKNKADDGDKGAHC